MFTNQLIKCRDYHAAVSWAKSSIINMKAKGHMTLLYGTVCIMLAIATVFMELLTKIFLKEANVELKHKIWKSVTCSREQLQLCFMYKETNAITRHLRQALWVSENVASLWVTVYFLQKWQESEVNNSNHNMLLTATILPSYITLSLVHPGIKVYCSRNT